MDPAAFLGMMASNNHDWETPSEVFDALDQEFRFTLDPCCTAETAKCAKFYTKADDGLAQSWAGEIVFMNPPYGREIGRWIEKACGEIEATVVCLIPARTDTRWWHRWCMRANEVRLVEGRVCFRRGGRVGSAPFPSAAVVYRSGPRTGPPVFSSWHWAPE